ncbi:ankyrin repeat domain-containing protein [Wolbachia endosymbiont of Pentidionis agamae]|uniref:ankyrin repeat domain-containing protein n=1 Tax=Wolbachia endosymbiont of Pentidionis agamae TaxID=3110435 RepID=UPI002FD13727
MDIVEALGDAIDISEIFSSSTKITQVTGMQDTTTKIPQTTQKQYVTTEAPRSTEKPQVMNKDGDTALHLAVVRDDLNSVKLLIKGVADVDVKNKYDATQLHAASIRGNLEIAKFLFDHGADVNAQAVNGFTPLNLATLNNQLAMVKLLLDRHADVNLKECESYEEHNFGYGRTPLISAVVGCNVEIAKLLLDKCADITIKARGLTALDFANTNKDKCPEMLTLLSDSRNHCTSTMSTSSASRMSSFLSSLLNWIKDLPQNAISLLGSQKCSHIHNTLSNNSWNSVAKGLIAETPYLLTEHDSTTVTAVPEINTTVVNNTVTLGILVAGLLNKTQCKQPIHKNLLSPKEQSMRLNNIDEGRIKRSIQYGKGKFENPNTDMNEAKVFCGITKRKKTLL